MPFLFQNIILKNIISTKQHKLKTYFVCTWNTYQSFQKIMQKMCQKLTCMFSNWLKIIPFTLSRLILIHAKNCLVIVLILLHNLKVILICLFSIFKKIIFFSFLQGNFSVVLACSVYFGFWRIFFISVD